MTLWVLAYSGHDSQVFLVEAETKAEAKGKATTVNYGVEPLGEPEPVEEVMADDEIVRLA